MIQKLKKEFLKSKDNIAYIINDEKITYGDLYKEASNVAKLLNKQGSSPVIIYGHKNIEMIISIIACLIANRAYIPIEVGTPLSRIAKIINITKSTLIIKNEDIKFDNIECITLKELEKYLNNENIINNNDIAYIIFTSGSTGEPKGVPISYKNLENFIMWISNISTLSKYENINVLNQASFSFDLSVADIFYSLFNSHTLVALDKKCQNDYNDIFTTISKNKINLIVATPTFIKMCLLNKDFNEQNYPHIDCLYFCGETLEIKTVNRIYNSFPNINIINAYGPTEATSAVSSILITKDMVENEEILPVGDIKNFATDIFIENNEIILKGKSVFSGYLNNISGGYYKDNKINCYKTGDIGFIKDDKLYCKGRIDNQIKYKGYRIELFDIESNINNIKNVIDCAVVCKYNEDNIVKNIIAYVVVDNQIDMSYVKTELKKKVPIYMIPNQFKQLKELPTNKNGKIDRKMLMNL